MLAAVKTQPRIMYRVGKHSPGLSTYPLWARWLIRLVYFVTGYQVTSHDIGIAKDEAEAVSWCVDDTHFYKPLYVSQPITADCAAPGPVVWPHSEAKELYQNHYPDLVTLTKQQFETLQGAVDVTCRSAHRSAR